MAISISYLSVGSRLKDDAGNKFIIVAKNHYAKGQSTVWAENCVTKMKMSNDLMGYVTYETTEINNYLKNIYPLSLSNVVRKNTVPTRISYRNRVSLSIWEDLSFVGSYFLLSRTELGHNVHAEGENNKVMSYLNAQRNRVCSMTYWTRTEERHDSPESNVFIYFQANGEGNYDSPVTDSHGVRPAFNLSHNVMVTDEAEDGYYRILDGIPPSIGNIPNMNGNYASETTINYTVTNEEGHKLTHYFSIDNGKSWEQITPSQNGNNYSFSFLFNELKVHYCRVKVVDTAGNSDTSNVFTVTINESSPTVTILGHNGLDIRFKASCITSKVSKVEIFINDVLQETLADNLEYNLTCSINKDLLTKTKNTMQIKATSKSNLVGSKDVEVIKHTYDVPPVGSKVIINNEIYTVLNASKVGSNIILNLVEELVADVSKGDLISVLQDNVKVKCSLSNLESKTNYKDMTLVKVKTLKGDFEGYIEEKYVLEGEGRYSAIKLELERFSEDVNVEVAELQQMFDYLED